MHISFPEGTTISCDDDIRKLRGLWTQALSSWHSPYKALIDCQNLKLVGSPSMAEEWKRLVGFLNGFFMKSAILYNYDTSKGHDFLPFEHFEEEEARQKAGLKPRSKGESSDFRSSITIANHFQQHVMELSFEQPTQLATQEQLEILKSKISNNLMQWHSAWNLLIDCSQLTIQNEVKDPFQKMLKYFNSFFLKKVLGYSPGAPKDTYPFEVYRARHSAAGRLESEGLTSGKDANCSSRKP